MFISCLILKRPEIKAVSVICKFCEAKRASVRCNLRRLVMSNGGSFRRKHLYLVLVCFQSTMRKKENLLWIQCCYKYHNLTTTPPPPPPPPHCPGISNSLRGGGMAIFWNHTFPSHVPLIDIQILAVCRVFVMQT